MDRLEPKFGYRVDQNFVHPDEPIFAAPPQRGYWTFGSWLNSPGADVARAPAQIDLNRA